MRSTSIFFATVALSGLLAAQSVAQARVSGYTFTDINVPGSAPGTTGSQPNYGMNNLGQIVGGYTDNSGAEHGFIYSRGRYVTFNVPGATLTTLNGINDWGQMVGTYCTSTNCASFLYDRGKFVNIGDPDSFLPTAINDRGQILGVGGSTGIHAIYKNGVFTTIPVPEALFSLLDFGFNNLGQVVGTYVDSAFTGHSFIEKNGIFTPVVAPGAGPGGGTIVYGINDLGQIAGNFFDIAGNGHGFIDTHGDFTTIDDPNAVAGSTNAELINDIGQVFGFYFDAAGNLDSFLATPLHGLLPATPIHDLAVSAADTLTAVPETSSWVLIIIGFTGLSVARLRQTQQKRTPKLS